MSTRTPQLADIIRQAIEDRLVDVHTMLPGRIDSYDATTQKADVEPLIARLQSTVDGDIAEDLPIIPGVPVVFPRTQAFKLTMPVQEGDRCMLVFCESSTEGYQVGQGRQGTSSAIKQTDPDTFARHNLTDPVALLGWYNDAEALSSTDQDGMQLGETSGAIVHIGNDLVELYEKGAADFVALAAQVKTELDRAKANAQAAVDYTTGFIAAFTAATVLAQDGGATLQSTTLLGAPSAPTLADHQEVKAEKVKAT